jgi:hypothetical protein
MPNVYMNWTIASTIPPDGQYLTFTTTTVGESVTCTQCLSTIIGGVWNRDRTEGADSRKVTHYLGNPTEVIS